MSTYHHSTYCNVPYASQKGTKNLGFFDVKKYPGQIKKVSELANKPEFYNLVKSINEDSIFATYGCDYGVEHETYLYEVSSFVNLYIYDLEVNEHEGIYNDIVGTFLKKFADNDQDKTMIDFTINPTNFHDFGRIRKGVKPKEETVVFRGWSLNCKIIGVADNLEQTEQSWLYGIDKCTEFFKDYRYEKN